MSRETILRLYQNNAFRRTSHNGYRIALLHFAEHIAIGISHGISQLYIGQDVAQEMLPAKSQSYILRHVMRNSSHSICARECVRMSGTILEDPFLWKSLKPYCESFMTHRANGPEDFS